VKKNIVIATIMTFCFVGIVSTFLITSTQSQTKEVPKTQESDENVPLVIYDDSKQSAIISEDRKKRNAKFNKSLFVQPTISDSVTEVSRMSDWQIGLSSLPVNKSDAVIVGFVNSSEAFLSIDKTGIYSEFSVQVTDLVKDNQNRRIKIGKKIVAQRSGGRVSYPTGKTVRYTISGQDMPRLNNKYVFFLTYSTNTKTYTILTGYEIYEGKVTALDGKGRSKSAGFDFSKYDGYDEKQFMNELQTEVYSQIDSEKEKLK
jgi:hypothetical protein